ncbi:Glutathione S-transferase [Cystobacter fuscus DSM 2262]|uniref:Glutathione S-transferase n=1 Tax=Cystobacter fuscus (strain ATCC 25194 / DSM 2262 / NBRC 100088 / M29) TaxID=1242864 RepID=S9P565_CYSF2|nr:glutathione S-transferase family protein [Cystobacter fuscus]EPX59570.1 Glutathione S-transferase [Cystobacter fuscus DSM 2262]
MMRILFHIQTSPFARRTRLALAHKGLTVELRHVRAHPEFLEESRRLSPLKTTPVLVEEDGRVLGDSTAISHYLDRAYPSAPRLWPSEPDDALAVFEVASLVDVALGTVADLGARYYALHSSEAWSAVKTEAMERVQRALDALGQRVSVLSRPTIARSGWSAADMWLVTAEHWLATLPQRAPKYPVLAQMVSLGWRLPSELRRWADQHRNRPDMIALG